MASLFNGDVMAHSINDKKAAPVVVESYVVTIFSPTSYTEEQAKEIIEKALKAAGSDLQIVGCSFGWKM